MSRVQVERAAAAAARNVNAYGQKEEGPSRWQERKEAKRQMYLMSTEKAVKVGVRKDQKQINGQCQKCFQPGHWTYECKNERIYMTRPSRSQQLRNPKLQPKPLDPSEVRQFLDEGELKKLKKEEDEKKRSRKKDRKKRKGKSMGRRSVSSSDDSESDSSSGSESDSSSTSASSSGSESESESEVSSDSQERKKRSKKRRRYSPSSSSDSESSEDEDDDLKKKKKNGKR